MSTVTFNYGNWEFWSDYDPPSTYYGAQKVTFDGLNKLIYINEGETEIDVKRDLYSNWKEWVLSNQGFPYPSSWPPAFTAVGGDAITPTVSLGSTYFLENGWRIKPWESEAGYVLTISGNIYTRETGENPVVSTSGVSVSLTRSNLIDIVTPAISISSADALTIATAVWEQLTSSPVSGSYGQLVQNIDSDLQIVKVEAQDALKKGEFLALQN